MAEFPDGFRIGIAELFEEGVSNGVIISQVGWFDPFGCPFHPFHKIEGAILKVNDYHFTVGDVKIILADGAPNIPSDLNNWNLVKEEIPEASRDECFKAIKKSFVEGL